MGGQACVLYGAAEFTRDSDFVVGADEANLARLKAALADLQAKPAYVPPISVDTLLKGHACHFRCGLRGLEDWRIDVMARLRGCEEFERLWARRRRVRLLRHGAVDTLAITDLVRAKKTQREKDWPMIARLVEADYLRSRKWPGRAQIEFWLREARTSDLLLRLVRRFRGAARRLAAQRPAVAAALQQDLQLIERELHREQQQERAADRAYWTPLRVELRRWRLATRGQRRR